MEVKLSNCNNIESGALILDEGGLNVKYAINGTGKSTIAQAIVAQVNGDEQGLERLLPYKYLQDAENNKPSISGLDTIHSVMLFNEDYVNQYVYQSDELIKDSFEIFVKTPDYDRHMKEIETLLKEINIVFKTHDELDELINNFNLFVEGFGKSKSGYSAAGIIGKGVGKGNKIENIPKGLEVYSPYLTHTEDSMNVKWIKWQIDGKQYLELADQCPYCSNSKGLKRETILKVGKEYNAKDVEHLNKIIQVFNKLMPYFDERTKQIIKEITNNISGITDQQKDYLLEVKKQVINIRDHLVNLKNIGFYSLKDANRVADELKKYVIDISLFNHFDSEEMRRKIDVINGSLKVVLEKAGKLQGELNIQKKLIKQTIEKNSSKINEFLCCAGYKYKVFIEENENEEYRMLLKPITVNEEIKSVKNHLSYGERNAFALVLFMFAALKDNPDLIILDDPISSFDGNKKFAIIYMLFLSKECFRGKTVLLLTHEFNTVIDVVRTVPHRFHPVPSAYFLTTKKGVLEEKRIRKNDIRSFRQIALKNISEPLYTINKLVYLRRLLEFENEQDDGEKGEAWNLLSNLFHKRKIPEISKRPMTDTEVKNATLEICKYIPSFDYSKEYINVTDKEKLIEMYRCANSNYEKLQIYRILYDGDEKNNPVIQKFINEVFHIENDCMFQLNPRLYDTVPQYIIDECDKDIKQEIRYK